MVMSLRDTIIARTSSAIARLTVRSALNPMLWLCGIVTVPSIIAATVMTVVPVWVEILAVGPVAVACVGFLYLLFFDRDKLQSESYQLRKQALELIEEKGDLRIVEASSIEVISNPDLPVLPPPREGGE